ncbi:MAG: EamA family transporter [Acidobacteriota bacterium]|nr:EamA family transporter [Acidobacteriota bacterium]
MALLLVLLSALLHASWNTATKDSTNPAAFLFLIGGWTTLVLAPMLLLVPWAAFGLELWALVLATSVTHGVYSWALTRAYEVGDLTLVYPISRSTPAFVPFVAVPLLGERLSAIGVAGIAVVVVGVWMVQTGGRLRGDAWRAPGLTFAYLTLASTVAYSLVDKRAMEVLDGAAWEGPLSRSVVFYYLLAATHLPFFWLLARGRLTSSELRATARGRSKLLLGSAAAALVSYSLILEALRTAPVSYVVAARQSSVVFVVVMAMMWLRERPTGARLVGILLTVAGVATIAFA